MSDVSTSALRSACATRRLTEAGVRPEARARRRAATGPLAGKTFVLTGSLPTLTRDQAARLIQEAGGTLVGVYVTLGRYDVVEIFEAPDDELAVEIVLRLQRFGAEHTETLRAFTRNEAEEIIRRL